jgi:Ca2+-binding EF-hand superfamily protein
MAVPFLPMGSPKAAKQAVANDEVAAMLEALKLDKGFFERHLRRGSAALGGAEEEGSSFDSDRVKKWRSRPSRCSGDAPLTKDFDVYLGEALMPVLAQSLDSLCRKVSRMNEQGDELDPKVRARFNPLTFLAQQLLRRHPKGAKTPRRQELYQKFHGWADFERGRREMVRRKADVMDVFSGFVLRGVVQTEDIPNVLKAVDDTMHIQGRLANHKAVATGSAFGARARLNSDAEAMGTSPIASPMAPRRSRARSSFFQNSSGVGWPKFWGMLSSTLMSNDVVPHSALLRGDRRKKEELEERARRAEAETRLAEAQSQREVDYQRQMAAYEELHKRLTASEQLCLILQENKILTGDDVRPKDPGFEFEIPPKGEHIHLLQQLMELLGLLETREVPRDGKEWWWTADKADAWTILQEIHNAELTDGVVEREVLEKVLVPPSGFMALKLRVADELEKRAEAKGEMEHLKMDYMRMPTTSNEDTKPSFEKLCENTGMSLERIKWLHQLFESYLGPDPNNPDELLVDNYPDDPAFIDKETMMKLAMEVQPDLGISEFEARFQRIDRDGSGQVEFDEFVAWIHSDEIRVMGDLNKKMTFEELAAAHDESMDVIMYLHNCFQDALPDGTVDAYPENPVGLVGDELKELVLILTPGVSAEDVSRAFSSVDADAKGELDFDEFLEVLNLDELPQELREQASPSG